MNRKNNTLLFVGISLILIISAIAATAIISRTKDGGSSDIRAKAGVTTTLRMKAMVATIDETKGTIVVSGLMFSDSQNDLGSWTVTPPPGLSVSSLSAGQTISLSVDPSSMDVATHTVRATQLIVER